MTAQLSLSLAGLSRAADLPWSAGPRASMEWAAKLGYRGIQLDATAPGLRPRELDRSGRRDIATLLRRLGLNLSGLDLWIPAEHFADPVHQTRAMGAVESALELAADLRGAADQEPVISVSLPARPESSLRVQIAGLADRLGVPVADHAVRPEDAGILKNEGPLGFGVDPAEVARAGADVLRLVAKLGVSIRSARLSDWSGTRRVMPGGKGRLDLLAYSAALSVAGYNRPIVVDLRDLDEQARAAADVLSRWPAL